MKKLFTLLFIGSFIVALLNIGLSSRTTKLHTFSLASNDTISSKNLTASGLTALGGQFASENHIARASEVADYAKAIEVGEGGSASFEGLSVTVSSVATSSSCLSTQCMTVELQLSVDNETVDYSSHKLGEVLSYKGYEVKISQIAPLEVLPGVSRRVVLLFSRDVQ